MICLNRFHLPPSFWITGRIGRSRDTVSPVKSTYSSLCEGEEGRYDMSYSVSGSCRYSVLSRSNKSVWPTHPAPVGSSVHNSYTNLCRKFDTEQE